MIQETQIASNTSNQLIISNNLNKSKPPKKLKLHSSDIAYMKVIRFYQTIAKNRKCHLRPEQWPIELAEFGGKPLSHHQRKKKRQKLERLKYAISTYDHGNRNQEKIPWLTNEGLKALEKWEESYPQGGRKPQRKLSTDEKNDPAECKKRPGCGQKTTRPLDSSGSLVNIVNDHGIAKRNLGNPEVPKPTPMLKTLLALGLYRGEANRILKTFSEKDIQTAFKTTQQRRPANPGRYLVIILDNSLKESLKDTRDYGLEEKSAREKEAEYGAAKRSSIARALADSMRAP